MSSRTRLEDLASIAGVSIATVSRALNNSPAVNDETKRRVWKIAREQNYHFRPSMPALLSGASATIAVVIPNPHARQSEALHPFVQDFIGGITEAARVSGCDLLISHLAPGNVDDLSELMTSSHADGIIFLGQRLLHDRLNALAQGESRFIVWVLTCPARSIARSAPTTCAAGRGRHRTSSISAGAGLPFWVTPPRRKCSIGMKAMSRRTGAPTWPLIPP
jgi:DNA-binding LacI/PurR family transcriptional regulator